MDRKIDGRANNGGHKNSGRKIKAEKMMTFSVRLTSEQAEYTQFYRSKFIRDLIQQEINREQFGKSE